MSLAELHCADEVFTTGTMGEVSFRESSCRILQSILFGRFLRDILRSLKAREVHSWWGDIPQVSSCRSRGV